jgi:hypothetical protein
MTKQHGVYQGEIVLYQAPDGSVSMDVKLERETIWLTQRQMSELFDTERSVITKHLNNIFASGELDKESNVQKMHIPGSDKPVAFHALDAVLSVGHRVNSKRGTQFTRVLREHLLKGYTINERRLRDLYPSLEEKAAHLPYFLIKNHAFVDGNKRIGAACSSGFWRRTGRSGIEKASDAFQMPPSWQSPC